MRFQHQTTYDGTAAQSYAMLIDPAFREAVCERQGSLSQSIVIDADSASAKVTINQVLPAEGIPSFAAKFVGDEIQLLRTEEWITPTQANIEIAIPGKPGQLQGTLILTEEGGHTTQTLDSQLKVSIPFIGAKIESLVADLFKSALNAEAAVAKTWLTN
jgi:Protein of unknown function (DUF2505)